MSATKIINVTPDNAEEETFFCIKDIKKPGFKSKQQWFEKRYKEGLKLKILKNESNKMIGFIEYIPACDAWRPVDANNFMFIHCMAVYSKKDRNKGYGKLLINEAEKDAKAKKMAGVCTMTSQGSWIADKRIFKQNGFNEIDKRGRFELFSKKWDAKAPNPKLFDWTAQQNKYQGWHIVYADQCPWHEKSVSNLLNVAMNFDIDLKITQINTAKEAKNAPSGFGVFSLLHDGKLLEDHYLSATRFKNILKKELEK
ncbi:MAG: GNAT family N-acetyltransferase [Algibacter sp.]|uniref:GNAT family N-acetyltransferase n=1 Tax=Algibacter sp. TaxID=1872428 RepID=UPI002638A7AD|nr:GNAT family N-acetyltransferase [Algibacter sp.]MDG1730364.1 GNAT family N-acetyltransferase [Algibacter sp.]MDG2178842.1 GNAT family N-acetyltransferase [Algibacter sp.]